jgi:hypothetical protein
MTDNDTDNGEFSLLRLLPHIVRARDFRLYAADGRRFVDLWQNGGAAVLGHTPPLFLREIKNTASRGLYAPFPHFAEQRFIKALSQILPGRSFRIYAAPPAELIAHNAIREMFRNGNAGIWRPFLDFCLPDAAPMGEGPPLVIPVLPGIQGWRNGLPLGLCVCTSFPGLGEEFLPPGDFLPPVLLAAAARGIWDLIAAAPERTGPQWPRVNKALKNSRWQRRGIYIFPQNQAETAPAVSIVSEEWAALFRRFLDAGFLLPPVPYQPLILPGILSPGEEAKLAEVLLSVRD